VVSYGGLVDRDTIHGRDVQLMHDDDVVAHIMSCIDADRRHREDCPSG
jgi:hypothetical protein